MQRKKEIKTYIVEGYEVEPMPFFLYEVSVCKIGKNIFETLYIKQFKSNKALAFTHTQYKKIDDYSYVKIIDLLGAPIDYIEKHKNKKYVTNRKSSK